MNTMDSFEEKRTDFPKRGNRSGPITALVIALGVIGLISRAAPLLDVDGRLTRQFASEDGYLMLTIARNLAIGKGMSIADGTIETNGTQPLVSFGYAVCFAAVDGDRWSGVLLCSILSLLVSVLAALAVYGLTCACMESHTHRRRIAAITAGLWFASPLIVAHSMNLLETGAYAMIVAIVLAQFIRWHAGIDVPWKWTRLVGLGCLLGATFWTRNDGAFLILAVCLTHVIRGILSSQTPLKRRLPETIVFGGLATVIAAPWMIYNYRLFGSIVPISGIAQSHETDMGTNLRRLPVILAEYVCSVLPVPSSIESHAILVGATTVGLGLLCLLLLLWRRGMSPGLRIVLCAPLMYLLLLCGYYGLRFGAPHFLSRYLMPASVFLAPVGVLGFVCIVDRVLGNVLFRRTVYAVAAVAVLVLCAGLNYRLYRRGAEHMHFQVVAWVQENVPEDTWVGAIQTGTLGFYHDRTINLDGKVNPHAMEARLQNRVPEYVRDSEIQYLVDWVGIGTWIEFPALREDFELIVEDAQLNLAVLRRKGAPGRSERGEGVQRNDDQP